MMDESHGAHPSHPNHLTHPAESAGSPSSSESEPTQPEACLSTPADVTPVSPSPEVTSSQDPQPCKIGLRRRILILGIAGAGAFIVGGAILVRCTTEHQSSPTPTATDSPTSAAYRPAYHYNPATGNLADPSGLVPYEGEYHLFHQQNGTWGHAISSDMVCWKRQGMALEHDVQGLVMSGSCVVDGANTSGLVTGGGMVAVHTSTEGGEIQSLAYPTDRGRSWRHFFDNPVIPNDEREDPHDPRVFWHEGSEAWIMTVSAGDHASLFRPTDLKAWSHASDFGQSTGSHAAVWECFDLFPLTGSSDRRTCWVMILSTGANEEMAGSTTQHFAGDFDGSVFFPEDRDICFTDVGQDFHVVQSPEHAEGRRAWATWLGNWNYPYSLPAGDWRGEVSIPRKLSLTTIGGKHTFVQKPVPELDALRGRATDLFGRQATDTATTLGTSRTVEIDLTLDIPYTSEAWLGLAHGMVDGKTQEVHVGVDISADTFYLDRTDGGLTQVDGKDEGTITDLALRRQTWYRSTSSTVHPYLYLDYSSLEVFVDDSATVGSLLVFIASSYQEIALGVQGIATITSGSLTPLAAAL